MKLMIVESPAKIKKIASVLGAGWTIKASFGHFRDLPQKELGVEIENGFKPRYVPTERGGSVISQLKALAKTADEVWLATDLDREGEAIAWHLKDALGLKQPKRVTFNAITKTAITQAMQTPRTIDQQMVLAQEGRRVIDRLVGYLVSPKISDLITDSGFLSAGRVQTPALGLVVAREKAITGFVPIDYVEVFLHFLQGDTRWSAQWDPRPFFSEGQTHWTDQAFAQKIAAITPVTVKSIAATAEKKGPPAPFITSTLQQACSVTLKIMPEKTMQVAQKLYEAGYITYMRTDAPNLSPEAITAVQQWLQQHGFGADIATPPNHWKAKEAAQEAHEAIRPTEIGVSSIELADPDLPLLQAVYDLIWQRAVACQMRAAEYDVQTLTLDGGQREGRPVLFVTRGSVLRYPGWKRLVQQDATEDQEEPHDASLEKNNKNEKNQQAALSVCLPNLAAGMVLPVQQGECKAARTKPPARYTEASLNRALEALGIGRPSTYATISATLRKRHYVRTEKLKLYAEPLGIQVFELVEQYFAFAQAHYTGAVESRLDLIAVRKDSYLAVVTDIYQQLAQEITRLPAVSPGARRAVSVAAKPAAKRASKTPAKLTADRKATATAVSKPDQAVVQGDKCPTCKKGEIRLKLIEQGKNAGKSFLGCSNFPACKQFAWPRTPSAPNAMA